MMKEEYVQFVIENWQGFVYFGVILLAAGGLLWWSFRPLNIGVGRMRPDEEKRINRVTAYYMTDALLQAVVDDKLSMGEADLIGRRVGRILGIPGLLPQRIVNTPSLKEELKQHRAKPVNGTQPVKQTEKTKTPFSKFFVAKS